uniref:SCAN box domain-containing protein n=1 Tax=Cyprinus carpio carpio TaxID=630221 RepID=A0A9J8C9Q5_CYPCA
MRGGRVTRGDQTGNKKTESTHIERGHRVEGEVAMEGEALKGASGGEDEDDVHEYEKVKTAILKKYDINPETYRQRFRSLYVEPEESPKELYVRLKELYVKWIQPQGKTLHEISEILIMEQFLRMLSPELQVWVKEHGPKSAAEAATL